MRVLIRATRPTLLCTALLLAAPGWGELGWGELGWAQEQPVNWYLTTPITLQSGFDSGIPDGNRKINSPATLLTLPAVSMMRTSPRNDFSVFYQADFEMFTGNPHLDSWNHTAGLHWEANMSPRWTFTLNDAFSGNRDNGERFESSFLLPRGPYHENGLYSSLNFDLTPTTKIKFRYENAFADFRSQDLATPIFFSRMGNTVGITMDQHITPRSSLSVSYSYLRSRSFDDFDPAGNRILPFSPTHYAGATYTFNPTPSLTLEANGGYVHNPQNSYVLGGLVEKHTRRMTMAAGYNRYLTFVGSPTAASITSFSGVTAARALPPNSITNTVSVRAHGYFTQHWGVEAVILASRTGAGTNQALRSAMGGLRVNYRISDHFVAFTAVDLYRQNANPILPVPISRGRYFGGIEYTFSPTPDEISRRHDAARNSAAISQTQTPTSKKEN